MKNSHQAALDRFERRIASLLVVRSAIRSAAIWFFVWGVVVLVGRISGIITLEWLIGGLLGFIPLSVLFALRAWRRRPARSLVRATFDQMNQCGGLLMAGEAGDVSSWEQFVPVTAVPELRWRSARSLALLGASALFVATAILAPDRFALFPPQSRLEIGGLVEELQAEVQLLEEEQIIEEKKSLDLKDQLARLKDQSSGLDPNKTWEALDHIKESNAEAAREAAEEAEAKMTSLTQAETLASALHLASENGLSSEVATRASQDLASLLKAAQLEEGLLKIDLPSDLLKAGENGLTPEQMEKLLAALQSNKANLGKLAERLANLKLIDAETLARCMNSGQCANTNALAAFLCQSGEECDSFSALVAGYGRGGVSRGRGDAPMTWMDPSAEEGAGFKEEILPPSAALADARLIGLSRAAPDLSGEEVVATHGALAGSESGGGLAQSRTILPRHKRTVERFFKREE
jgi:hypothetical protein